MKARAVAAVAALLAASCGRTTLLPAEVTGWQRVAEHRELQVRVGQDFDGNVTTRLENVLVPERCYVSVRLESGKELTLSAECTQYERVPAGGWIVLRKRWKFIEGVEAWSTASPEGERAHVD